MLRRVVVAGLVLAASSLVDAIPVHGVELESEVLDLEEINLPAMIEFEASEPVKVDIPPPTPAPTAPIVQAAPAPEAPPARPPVNFDFKSLKRSPLGKLKVMTLPDPKNLLNGLYKKPSPAATSNPDEIPEVHEHPGAPKNPDSVPFTTTETVTMNVTQKAPVPEEEQFINMKKSNEGGPLGKLPTVPHSDGKPAPPAIISTPAVTPGPIITNPAVANTVIPPTSFIDTAATVQVEQQRAPFFDPIQFENNRENVRLLRAGEGGPLGLYRPSPVAATHVYVPVPVPVAVGGRRPFFDPIQFEDNRYGGALYRSGTVGPLGRLRAELRHLPADSFIETGAAPYQSYQSYQPEIRVQQHMPAAHELASAMFDQWVNQNQY